LWTFVLGSRGMPARNSVHLVHLCAATMTAAEILQEQTVTLGQPEAHLRESANILRGPWTHPTSRPTSSRCSSSSASAMSGTRSTRRSSTRPATSSWPGSPSCTGFRSPRTATGATCAPRPRTSARRCSAPCARSRRPILTRCSTVCSATRRGSIRIDCPTRCTTRPSSTVAGLPPSTA